MLYPLTQYACSKLVDVTSKYEARAEAFGFVGPCDECPHSTECLGPELFKLGRATSELRKLQSDIEALSMHDRRVGFDRRATGGA